MSQRFAELIDGGVLSHIDICNIYETRMVRGVGMIVSAEATQLPSRRSVSLAMDADHVHLTKFSSPLDSNYQKIQETLVRWVDRINKEGSAKSTPSMSPILPTANRSVYGEIRNVMTINSTDVPQDSFYKEIAHLMDEGQYEDAEIMQRKICTRIDGEEHATTMDRLTALANLAAILGRCGKWDEAEALQCALLDEMQNFEDTDNVKMSARVNLAFALTNLGSIKEAERLLRLVLVPSYKGDETSKLFRAAQTDLAIVLAKQDKFPEARALLLCVLDDTKHLYGDDHPDTIVALVSLSVMYAEFARFDEAERYLTTALHTSEKITGHDHLQTQVILETMVGMKVMKGLLNDAIAVQEKLYGRTRGKYGPGHRMSLRATANLLWLLRLNKETRRAIRLAERELSNVRELRGRRDLETLDIAKEYVALLLEDGRLSQARTIQKQVVELSIQTLGAQHQQTAKAREIFDEIVKTE